MAAIMLTACHLSHPSDSKDYVFTDGYGRDVTVPASPTRIVSTSPAVTEIIYALGAEELLVGRTDFCTYPPEAQNIESIGGISNLNVEKVMSLKPDLIISGSMIPRKITTQLEQMGVPTACVIEQSHFDGLYDNIRKIGRLTGRQHTADSLVEKLQAICPAADARQPGISDNVPTVYYVVGFGSAGNFTAGGNSFINDIISLAGGRNIAADVTGWSYSLETLLTEAPDYIVIRKEDSAAFCNMAPYNRLAAVKANRVIGIESGMIDLQVPRNIDAIRLIRKRITD